MTTLELVARAAGVPVSGVTAIADAADALRTIGASDDVIEVAVNPPAEFFSAGGRLWMFAADMDDKPIDASTLAYNSTIGLHSTSW